MMKFEIKELTMNDALGYVRLKNSLVKEKAYILSNKIIKYKEGTYKIRRLVEEIKNKRYVSLVAYVGSQLVGACSIKRLSGNSNHIGELAIFVNKRFRRIGIGRALMENTIELAKKRMKGLEIVCVELFAVNKPAVSLYTKMGFKKVAEIPKRFKMEGRYYDGLIMNLYLT